MRCSRRLALVAIFALAGSARAEAPVSLRALFPKEAPVEAPAAGPTRLSLPIAVLAECRADLSDVRILGPGDREIPFLVDRNEAAAIARRGVRPRVLDVRREEIRPDDRPARAREIYEIASPPSDTGWELEIQSVLDRFDRRVRVEALTDGKSRTLVEAASLFRVRGAAGDLQENLALTIAPHGGGRLRLTIEGEGPFLEPSFYLSRSESIRGADEQTVPLDASPREASDGWSAFVARRPSGSVPKALRLRSTSRWFDRRVRVSDVRLGRTLAVLGEGRWSRVEEAAEVEPFVLPLRPGLGDILLVEIEDGDSPPLEELRVEAVLPRIDLVFLAPAGGLTLLFGGGRAEPPRYDLGALVPTGDRTLSLDRVRPAAWLLDRTNAGVAMLGDVAENPAFDERPALAFAMRPGALVDAALFSHRSVVELRPSKEGVARLRLGTRELAIARPDLADVRIVDGESRQWPYLIGARPASEAVPLAIGEREARDGRSRYPLALPAERIELLALELESELRFLDRGIQLFAVLDDGTEEERLLASTRLRRRDRARERGPLRVELSPTRVRSLVLVVDDGSEQPLSLSRATARVRLPEIFVTAPEGRYALLLGNPSAEPPRYELSAVSAVVWSVESLLATSGSPEANPEHRPAARALSPRDLETAAFWLALVVAAAVLGGLTLRLVRAES